MQLQRHCALRLQHITSMGYYTPSAFTAAGEATYTHHTSDETNKRMHEEATSGSTRALPPDIC
jgi:hypothetical protein